jgi:DNA (cytosine-5)-methyltransferase 1
MPTVADFFSCGGGTSAGFYRRGFQIVGAVDAELSKPSIGSSFCNETYEANHGIAPMKRDMFELGPDEFARASGIAKGELSVMISCAPCTDFTRTKPSNHANDTRKNGLVGRSVDFASELLPEVFFMENARELLVGNFASHYHSLKERLEGLGYDVRANVHVLTKFGLPQIRERALIVASRIGPARTLEDLWEGWKVAPKALTVRSALGRLEQWRKTTREPDYEGGVFPALTPSVLGRLRATPQDGGSWIDVARNPRTRKLLTADCRRRWDAKLTSSHPDVYGRMAWDRPAPTIKRECAHVGNGRYAHPEHDRLLSVREMATLQGFPFDYRFPARAVANRYRHIGDAVPPLIAYQMSALATWMKTGMKPSIEEMVMPATSLRVGDIKKSD